VSTVLCTAVYSRVYTVQSMQLRKSFVQGWSCAHIHNLTIHMASPVNGLALCIALFE